MKPKVLIVTTTRWIPTARLAMALANAGFAVEAVCPRRHPLEKVSCIQTIHSYDVFSPASSFAEAISASGPILIIPGDEYAVRCLHALCAQAQKRGKWGESVCASIESSLGASEIFTTVTARAALMQLAERESIRVPKTFVATDLAELKSCCDRLLFPLVLKADGTSSGEGVKVVRTLEEAERWFRVLESPPSVLRAVKRSVIDQDMRLVRPVLFRERRTVNAQEFIEGSDATSLVACWKGKVLANLHFEVVKKQRKNGPASVLRRIDIAGMDVAISKIVGRLKISGLHGFDFLLEKQTGDPILIEMNPRPTQVGHLTLGPGHDLPAALHAQVTGTAIQEAPKTTENDTIALFPQEWIRNPSSIFLRSAHHDIPWEEPELIRFGARKPRNWTSSHTARKWVSTFLPDRMPPAND